MDLKKITWIVLSVLAMSTANASDLSDKLKLPNHVLLMRHTLAPGVGDPAGYSLEDCRTQRNLNDEGHQQAQTVGHWLKKQGVQTAEMHTSIWCRCQDTARLLNYGRVAVAPSLASFFDDMQLAQDRTQQLQRFIAEKVKTKAGKALILVTHHVNIYGFVHENIDSGDMVLAKVDSRGQMTSYQVIPRPR